MTPAEALLARRLVASGLSSAEADRVCAGLRTRAFFSSRVESVRLLQAARSRIAGMLSAAADPDSGAVQSRAEAIAAIRRAAEAEGLGDGTGGLADPASLARARLVVDTNAGMAAGYAARTIECSKGARAAYPAWRLVRVEGRSVPRDWAGRWNKARAELGAATTATMALNAGGPMVALKDDPIWTAISRFGQPWPPFDYNSGMGTEEVPRSECEALGLVAPDWQPQGNPVKDFNDGLEAQCGRLSPADRAFLEGAFGDQAEFGADGRVRWRADALADLAAGRGAGSALLGSATPDAAARAARAGIDIAGRALSVAGEDARRDAAAGADIELAAHVWRCPDSAARDPTTGDALLDWRSSDGTLLRLAARPSGRGMRYVSFGRAPEGGRP